MDVVRKIFDLLTPREKRNLYLVFLAVLIMAGLEVVSVASIMPFLSVASDPSSIQNNAYLAWAYTNFGFTDTNTFLIALGLLSLTALVVSNTYIVFVTWLMYRYVWNRNHSISKRLLLNYFRRPYEYFLTRNSSELSRNILDEAKEISTQILRPVLRGLAKAIVALFIIGFLVFINPTVAMSVAVVLGGAYGLVFVSVRSKLDELGKLRVEANGRRYQSVSEAFGGIKEVKLRGKENVFLEAYNGPSKRYAHYQTLNQTISRAPRYILEGIAFGGIILIAVYLIAVEESIEQVIPMLGLYAFAGYRLMPALQTAFKGLAKSRFTKEAVETIHRDMFDQTFRPELTNSQLSNTGSDENASDVKSKLKLQNCLSLRNLTFTYPGANKPAIRNLSLRVPARSTVGFVGKTGSGKTTVIDLMLGMLRPQDGTIWVDDTPLTDQNLQAWQQTVGYVPQHIYLTDDTIARNIAFGVPDDEIDMQAVEEATRRAQIHEFITNELADGFETEVGERGVKLSGGQQQRIGIARALYHRPSVIFFDEATSALDQKTEEEVMQAVYALGETRTVILVSHRLSTVERADRIFKLSEGKLVNEGSYENVVS